MFIQNDNELSELEVSAFKFEDTNFRSAIDSARYTDNSYSPGCINYGMFFFYQTGFIFA